MVKNIAVIGMAGRFPDAKNIDKLFSNLLEGKDSVKELSDKMIKERTLSSAFSYKCAGYLEDIDKFDHEFFNIPLGEAQEMDPSQRLLLEVVHETFENAGYSPEFMDGTNTSVFVSDIFPDYYKHAEKFSTTLMTGNQSCFLPTRISRHYNLNGNAMMVDTACSSSAIAIHLACNNLSVSESDYCLVCSSNLYFFPYLGEEGMGVNSPDGKSIAFDKEARGMSAGETVAALLLKPLDKALKDGDIIHGVIAGTAANNNANRAASPSAPDSLSQTNVLIRAWNNANIDPCDIGYIEAHGSGTQVGDIIECEGLTNAFKKYTNNTMFCPISTIKNNIGHGMGSAGLTGVIKALLGLKNRVLFQHINYLNPNPAINFDSSAIFVNKDSMKWETIGDQMRIAGVTSIGMSGTNCHIVVKESPIIKRDIDDSDKSKMYLFTVSAKSKESLKQNLIELNRKIASTSYHHKDISYTLIGGREHYKYRTAFLSNSIDDIRNKIDTEIKILEERDQNNYKNIVFILSDYLENMDDEYLDFLIKEHSIFSDNYNKCLKKSDNVNINIKSFAIQYSLYYLLKSYNITTSKILGLGLGQIVASVISENISLKDGINQAEMYQRGELTNIEDRVLKLIDRETEASTIFFIQLGPVSLISKNLFLQKKNFTSFNIFDFSNYDTPFLELLKQLYISGHAINWNYLCENINGHKVELPAYQFNKTRCWLIEKPKELEKDIKQSNIKDYIIEEGDDIEIEIAKNWSKILSINKFSIHDNFFELGGDSIDATRCINILKKRYNIDLDFEDAFDFPTISTFAKYIKSQLGVVENITQIWIDVLKSKEINLNDNFFELGGHSLLANQILVRVNNFYHLDLDFEDIFKNQTLFSFSEFVKKCFENGHNNEVPQIQKIPIQDSYELSSAQKRIWIVSQTDDCSIAYNTQFVCQINGELNYNLLCKAMDKLVERHESLRTNFHIENGELRQIINLINEHKFNIDEFDLSKNRNDIETYLEKDEMTPFNLESGFLFRFSIIRLEQNVSLLSYTNHHIISDGWSGNIFFSDLIKLYSSCLNDESVSLKPLRVQYKDYSTWHNKLLLSNTLKIQQDYWHKKLSGDIPVLDIIGDYPRPTFKSFRGSRVDFKLSKDITNNLQQLAYRNDSSLFMILQAIVKILLHKYTGNEDIIVGSPIAGRNNKDLENQIGIYINLLILRDFIISEYSFIETLENIKKTCIDAYKNQDYPYEKLVNELKVGSDPSHNPFFDILVILQNHSLNDLNMGDIHIEQYNNITKNSKMDLSFEFIENTEGLHCHIEYATDIYSKSRIVGMVEHFKTLVSSVLMNPESKIKYLEMIPKEEKNLLLHVFNNTKADYPRDKTIVQLFEEQVEKTPDNIAVVFEDIELTYRKLNEKANIVGNYLRDNYDIKADDLVGVLLNRSENMIIALWGILKSGAAYVPIDPDYPQERIEYMLKDSNPKAVLYENKDLSFNGIDISLIDDILQSGKSIDNLEHISDYNNLAYVIYTSGSTGRPKGTLIEHGSLVNRIDWMQRNYKLDENDTILQKTTFTFDVSVWELFWWSLYGAKVCFLKQGDEKDPVSIIRSIEKHNITTMHFVPSMYTLFLDQISTTNSIDKIKSLKNIFCSGEELTVNNVKESEQLIKKNNTKLINLYGPTEATIDVTYYNCDVSDKVIPIGKPISNIALYIVDTNGELSPLGTSGELCISGVGLARGYLNRPGLTAEKFIDSPFISGERMYKTGDLARWLPDGNIEFLSRIDHQVKIRGFRIELGEIENSLVQHNEISSAVILIKEGDNGDKYLVGYYVSDNELIVSKIRSFLGKSLPDYMIPSKYVFMDELPLTPNGKIDRKALPEPDGYVNTGVEYVAPENEIQEKLVDIWKGILNVENIGIYDSFFDIGGDSLKLLMVSSQLKKQLDLNISVLNLFTYTTIYSLVEYLENDNIIQHNFEIKTDIDSDKSSRSIAIIGMSGRFPGAINISEFWNNLKNGKDSISRYSKDELLEIGYSKDLLNNENFINAYGNLCDKEYFDSKFFGYSPVDAEFMNPQTRILHEEVWGALEDGGYNSDNYNGRIGLFTGGSTNSSWLISSFISNSSLSDMEIDKLANSNFISSRISHNLNLSGPSYNTNTACSTSLVNIVLGCENLINHRCDLAIAGGVATLSETKTGYMYQKGSINSSDGFCRAFSDEATGTVFGEGAGVLLLKRLDEAIRDKDNIHAVIKGYGTNNDGKRKVGYTAPSVLGQAELISDVQAQAGVTPESISYIEAHGTGTKMGDPVEFEALKMAFNSDQKQFCGIGSVKSNIGHLDEASGVAGVIKTIMSLKNRLLVPTLYSDKPNPLLNVEESPFYINTELKKWESSGDRLRAGISSFGIGGTNAHIIIEEAPILKNTPQVKAYEIINLSAKTKSSLINNIRNLLEFLKGDIEINLSDISYTLNVGRKHFDYRFSTIVSSINDLIEKLKNELVLGESIHQIHSKINFKTVFIFSGIDNYYKNMGFNLYENNRVFKENIDKCITILEEYSSINFKELLFANNKVYDSNITHCLMFIIEYSLTKLLNSRGVSQNYIIGNNLGEHTAACISGIISLEDILKLIYDSERADSSSKSPDKSQPHILEPKLVEFKHHLEKVKLHKPVIPFLSSASGKFIKVKEVKNIDFWFKTFSENKNLNSDVQIMLKEEKCNFIEIGSCNSLISLIDSNINNNRLKHEITIAGDEIKDLFNIQNVISKLWLHGTNIVWEEYYATENRKRISLPTYAFDKIYHGKLFNFMLDESKVNFSKDRDESSNKLAYIPCWKQSFIDKSSENQKNKYLIFVDDLGLSDKLAVKLKSEGHSVVTVKSGDKYYNTEDNIFFIDYAIQDHYFKLFQDLRKTDQVPEKIIHSLNLQKPVLDKKIIESVDKEFMRGLYSPLYISEAFHSIHVDKKINLYFLTNDVQDIIGYENLSPAKSVVLSVSKYLSAKYCNINCFNIDLMYSDIHIISDKLVDILCCELIISTIDQQVAYRKNNRWILDSKGFKFENNITKSKLIDNGVYLISDGFGSLGLGFCEAIARECNVKLIIISSEELPERQEWKSILSDENDTDIKSKILKIIKIENLGSKVLLLKADQSIREDLENVINIVNKKWGKINGAIYTPEILKSELITSDNIIVNDKELKSKIDGTIVFLEVLKEYRLDFMVFSPPILPFLNKGQQLSNTVLNEFMNCYANLYHSEGDIITSINWTNNRGFKSNNYTHTENIISTLVESGTLNKIFKHSFPNMDICINNLLDDIGNDHIKHNSEKITKSTIKGSEAQSEYKESTEDIQKKLVEIWAKLLGIDNIGVLDDFFELGGNSLKTITLASEIYKSFFIDISIYQLYEVSNIVELAELISSELDNNKTLKKDNIISEQDTVIGEVLFTAAQKWFFDEITIHSDPGNWNTKEIIEVSMPINVNKLKQVIEYILTYHDSLRATFHNEDGMIKQIISEPGTNVNVQSFNIEHILEADRKAYINDKMVMIQNEFNFSEGPLYAVVIFNLDNCAYLATCFHHLLIDGDSISILMNDIFYLYNQNIQNLELELPPKTLSMRQWTKMLDEYTKNVCIRNELSYWESLPYEDVVHLPKDFSNGRNIHNRINDFCFNLSAEDTSYLCKTFVNRHNVKVEDVLLAGFHYAVTKWTKSDWLMIPIVSNGRNIIPEIEYDLSRTIGWIASSRFLMLKKTKTESFISFTRDITDQIKDIPNYGNGLDLLSCLDLEISSAFKDIKYQVLFIYDGGEINEQSTRNNKNNDQLLVKNVPELMWDPRDVKDTYSDINLLKARGSIINNQLNICASYSEEIFNKETIDNVFENFKRFLLGLIEEDKLFVDNKDITN